MGPGIQAAVSWIVAVPGVRPAGTRKSTRYRSEVPGHPIWLIAGTAVPFTDTSTGELTTSNGSALNTCVPDGKRFGRVGPRFLARTIKTSPPRAGLAAVNGEKSL